MRKQNIVVTGANGFVARFLIPHLEKMEHEIIQLHYKKEPESSNEWNPDYGDITPSVFENTDMVIHLAGENIAVHKWSSNQKEYLYKNRRACIKTICEAFNDCKNPPKRILMASAIGFYAVSNDLGVSTVDEKSSHGNSTASQICQKMENEALQYLPKNTSLVRMRFGVVLNPEGGMLKKILPSFTFCLGGKIASGKQMLSWVSMTDLIRAITFLINHETIQGPVNITSPEPVSNKQFTNLLSKIIHRPAFLPMPAFVIKLLFGEMGEEFMLNGVNVKPTVLEQANFQFLYPNLTQALKHELAEKQIDS